MKAVQHILMLGVRLYRWVVSPAKTLLFGPLGRCRFTPSCSEYALEALRTHGALRGSWLAASRICRCHPWGGCGHDPVPEAKSKVQSLKSKVSDPIAESRKGHDPIGGRAFGLRASLRPHRIECKMDSISKPRNTRNTRKGCVEAGGFSAYSAYSAVLFRPLWFWLCQVRDFGFRISPQRGRAHSQGR